MTLRKRLSQIKHSIGLSVRDLNVPGARRRAWWYMMFFDHGMLRYFWTNLASVSAGVYRSNHPTQQRFYDYRQYGFNTVVNLRGVSAAPHYQLEVETCKALGFTLVDINNLSARSAPEREDLIILLDALRAARMPILIHCKSGADRTSLASAIYQLAVDNVSVAKAREQFALKFVHLKWTKAGVLDHILDHFEIAQAETGIAFEDWLRNQYDAATIQQSFEASRA